jgi:hypothetical protein
MRSLFGIGSSLYVVKLLVILRKEIVKTLTKVLRDSWDCNSKTAIERKDQLRG